MPSQSGKRTITKLLLGLGPNYIFLVGFYFLNQFLNPMAMFLLVLFGTVFPNG